MLNIPLNIPLYSRFIGGTNISHVLGMCANKSWIPIFDRAKEGNKTQSQVNINVKHILDDIRIIGDSDIKKGFYALKASTFAMDKSNMHHIYRITRDANNINMDIVFDAETSYTSPIEDFYTKSLLDSNLNVYKTYQLYRSDGLNRLLTDLDKGQVTCFKLVRGAYQNFETKSNNMLPSKDHVDHVYNSALKYLLSEMHNNKKIKLMIATHNNKSIKIAQDNLTDISSNDIRDRVYFAKLLGMGEDIKDYNFCRYVPYGKIVETIPYLSRRLVENYTVLKNM